jgi:hypothetical protein
MAATRFGRVARAFTRQELHFEYAWKPYRFAFEISNDGKQWRTLLDRTEKAAIGSPIVLKAEATTRYLRLIFPDDIAGSDISMFEWAVY